MSKISRVVAVLFAMFIVGGALAPVSAQPYGPERRDSHRHHRRPHCVRYHHGRCVRWSR